jgi:hypothetical protein
MGWPDAMTLGGFVGEPRPGADRSGNRYLTRWLVGKIAAITLETRLGAIVRRCRHRRVTKQGRHNFLRRTPEAIDRVGTPQRGHAAIARPFLGVEGRHPLGVGFDQRHTLGVGGQNEQLPFLLRLRFRQFLVEKPVGLLTHVTVDIFQLGHGNRLPKDPLELPGSHAKRLLDAEQLRKLLEQVGLLPFGQTQPRGDGPQFDFLFGTARVNECFERVLFEDTPHVLLLDGLAAVQIDA